MKEIIEKIYSKVGIKESKLKIEIVQIVITSISSKIEVICKIIQKGEYGKDHTRIKMENITKIIAEELNIKESQVNAAIKLIDEGNTIPFIARYRKEVTGGLSD